MTIFLSLVFACVCIFAASRAFTVVGGIFEYPVLFAIIGLGFIGPQIFWLIRSDSGLADGELDRAIFMMILSVVAAQVGFKLGVARPVTEKRWEFSPAGLVSASIVASIFGMGFYIALTFLPEDVLASTQWSGTPTAYLFFARALSIGMAVLAIVFATTNNRLALWFLLLDSAVILDRALGYGRRGDFAEWLFIMFLAIWFGQRKAPSRMQVIFAMVLAAAALNFIGAYRSVVNEVSPNAVIKLIEIDWSRLLEASWDSAFELEDSTASELRNAARDISIISQERVFDGGTSLWNTLVFNYFPAQLFGEEAKRALTIELETGRVLSEAYEPWAGSTRTGLSDAFASFWYFGALIFGFIAYWMGSMYKAAGRGSIVHALLYMCLLMPALHALTHHTHWFIAALPSLLLYLVPILIFAHFPQKPLAASPTTSATAAS